VVAMDRTTEIQGLGGLRIAAQGSDGTLLRRVDRHDPVSVWVGLRAGEFAEDVRPQFMPRDLGHRLDRQDVVRGNRPTACAPLRNQRGVNLEQAR